MLPKLNEAKNALSIINVGNNFIYAIGGLTHKGKPSLIVERLKIGEYILREQKITKADYDNYCNDKAWEIVDVSFPSVQIPGPIGVARGFY